MLIPVYIKNPFDNQNLLILNKDNIKMIINNYYNKIDFGKIFTMKLKND